MSDRALLEAAAKAAGMDVSFVGPQGVYTRAADCKAWNPLTDDGDALRLAVRLGIRIEPSQPGCSVMWPTLAGVRVETVLCGVIGADPYAATRRAIVRAAAEIGSKT